MKPPESHISALRYPLTTALGSKGHVIVLRELVRIGHPASHSELLERTSLSRQGVYDITKRLVESGVVKYTEFGRQQLVTLREDYPLYSVIKELFRAETNRYENFLGELHSVIRTLDKLPESAWIFGNTAETDDVYGDPVQIALLGNFRTIDSIVNDFRTKLIELRAESRYDVTLDVRGITLADLESKPYLLESDVILIWGISPNDFIKEGNNPTPKARIHSDLDEISYNDSRVWTTLLGLYPDIIPRAISYLDKQIENCTSGERLEYMEWKNLLESSSFQRLKKFMESKSERAVRLRQSMPFWSVLTDFEQKKFKQLQMENKLHEQSTT
jgi:hypothetical protein